MCTKFRDQAMLKMYAECLLAYTNRSSLLFAPDGETPARNNSAATLFWRGFDGSTVGRWDAASRRTFAYAQFCAGRDCAHVRGAA